MDVEHIDLLPCPFCGSKGESLVVEHLEGTILHPAYRVCCDNCAASSGYTDKCCRESWNTRASLTPPEDPAAEVAKRLIGRFMIECNAVGAHEAGYGLARALKREMPELLAARPEVSP